MQAAEYLSPNQSNETAYDDLIVSVEASEDTLSLLLAVCNDFQLREEIIQRYEDELSPEIQNYRITLPEKEPSLKQAIAQTIEKNPYLKAGGKAVFTVLGAERLQQLRYGAERSEQEIFLGYLQWTREGLQEFQYPIILWLTGQLFREVSRKARDFWSWRKDVFRFVSQPSTLDQDLKLSFPNQIAPTLLPPKLPKDDSMPLEDLQRLISQTEQKQESHLNDPLLATLYSNLGETYGSRIAQEDGEHLQSEIERALEAFQKAIKIQEALDVLTDLAQSFAWLGYLYELQGRYLEAEEPLEKALTIFQKQVETHHPSVTITLNNLAVSYFSQGRFEEAAQLAQQAMSQIPKNLPYGNTSFVGREAELEQIHQQLQQQSAVAISAVSGMGGIGKTELALQYARQHCLSYPGGLCWVRAREDVGAQIISFARSLLNLMSPDDLELAEKVRWCWRHWRKGVALLIFDDVQQYDDIAPFLPPQDSRFKVLMTTRLRLQLPVQNFEIEVLPQEKAINFLREIVPDGRIDEDLETTKEICQWLGYLPLGVELVGRYLARKTNLSLSMLWQRLQEKRLDAIAFKQAEPGMTASLGLAAAFELSWEILDEPARQLATLLSLFALAEIPWALVETCLPEEDAEALEDRRDESLLNLHLLERTRQGTYQLHQLLREFFAAKRSQMADAADMEQAFRSAVLGTANRSIETPDRSLFAETTVLMPHLQAVVQISEASGQATDLAIDLGWLALLYRAQGRYGEAEPLYIRALAIGEQQLGADHPTVATSLNNLALLYSAQGRYREAEPLYIRALAIGEQQLGADHPDVATSLNNLASLYSDQGRYGEAEPLFLRALAIGEQQLGADHPTVATRLNNLANLYSDQGRYGEAEPLYIRALAISKQQLGADHPTVANRLNNLALLYNAQGRYGEAEPLYIRALAISEQQLGTDHPTVAANLNNLANLYRAQGRYGEAEPLFLRALAIGEQQLGADHPTVAANLNNLALLYSAQGRYEEAEPLFLRALKILVNSLGTNHPNTRSVHDSLAILYNAMSSDFKLQGRYDKVAEYLEKAITLRSQLLQ